MKRILLAFVVFITTLGVQKTHAEPKKEIATFAGGCFWCVQPAFDGVKGVTETIVGYAGGQKLNPTYEEVGSGSTGHTESIQVMFDPAVVSYSQLLDVFWRQINPTQADGQFVDIGNQYRSSIFYHSGEQKRVAEESKKKLGTSGKFDKPIVTEIVAASKFYPAEEYHQKYYKKSQLRYKLYRSGSGRDAFIEKTWGKSSGH